MKDIAALIRNTLTSLSEGNPTYWLETNPTLDQVTFSYDEFDPRSPKLQVLFENYPENKVWLHDRTYRIEHKCRITVYLKPVRYVNSELETDKVTFFNLKNEIDRILSENKYDISGITNLELSVQGWNDANSIRVGRGTKDMGTFLESAGGKDTAIVFKSTQIVTALYYQDEIGPLAPRTGLAGTCITESDYLITKESNRYYAINGRTFATDFGGVLNAGGTDGTNATAVVNACASVLTEGGTIYLLDPIITEYPLLMRNNIKLVSNSVCGSIEDTPSITYTGDDYAIRELNESSWRDFDLLGLYILTTNPSCKGMIRLGKTNFSVVDEITLKGYASEAAINVPVSSLKGNHKKLENIDIEGELNIAIGLDLQADWCYVKNVVVSKSTNAAFRVGDQTNDEPPYEVYLENVHGFDCQGRFLDIQWAYYLMVNHAIDEHTIDFVGTKEASWYQEEASDEDHYGKISILFDCNAFYDIEEGYPPAPYVEFLDKQDNLVFMRNDSPSKGDSSKMGLKVLPKFIVDDNGRGVPDVLQVIGKHTDLVRLSNTNSYAAHNTGIEVTLALDETDFKIWNITDAKMLLQISWAGVLRPRDIIPFVADTYDLGSISWAWDSLFIHKIYLLDQGIIYMNNVPVIVFDEDDRILQNIQIPAENITGTGTLNESVLDGTTENVTVAKDGGGTITLQFRKGLYIGKW